MNHPTEILNNQNDFDNKLESLLAPLTSELSSPSKSVKNFEDYFNENDDNFSLNINEFLISLKEDDKNSFTSNFNSNFNSTFNSTSNLPSSGDQIFNFENFAIFEDGFEIPPSSNKNQSKNLGKQQSDNDDDDDDDNYNNTDNLFFG